MRCTGSCRLIFWRFLVCSLGLVFFPEDTRLPWSQTERPNRLVYGDRTRPDYKLGVQLLATRCRYRMQLPLGVTPVRTSPSNHGSNYSSLIALHRWIPAHWSGQSSVITSVRPCCSTVMPVLLLTLQQFKPDALSSFRWPLCVWTIKILNMGQFSALMVTIALFRIIATRSCWILMLGHA